MKLTQFSDFALRLLMFAAAHPDRLITIEEAANVYGVSRTHLMKVANQLTRHGFLTAVRGRSGGLRLARAPQEIGLGAIIRAMEPDFAMVECFATGNRCVLTPCCRLTGVVGEALAAFLAVFDRHTLADILLKPEDFGLAIPSPRSTPRPSGAARS
ncbi:RrF2 family transcriptional regulator [Ancylobacter amanitiformis]|uniref:Rrf2 family nitric oxide-sensitive transcriptional repressor n=1 Tax=Ancylobacter amanitiformis TaxID=217069 RepID=A0ABU0LUT6_9HYPH|nr:Rrf2 family transcriptional regulator [Ancylobacter amanitiformis]MDQ0512486.1 Rrf2 family nitric oxide-sensitive transcriptional repressor [Ancylobacter amanitiformis]